jgi:hypothetical protein
MVNLTPQGSQQKYRVGFFGTVALAGSVLLYLYGTMLESSPLKITAFVVLSGVAEEWLFRMWLCAWIYKFTRTMLIAVPVSSAIWAVFHLGRVGGELTDVSSILYIGMFLLLLTGIVLSYIFVGFQVAPFNFKNFALDLVAAVASFISIYYISSIVPSGIGGQFNYLFIVFLAGLPLGYLTLLFRSADGPVFGHMLVNFLSGR